MSFVRARTPNNSYRKKRTEWWIDGKMKVTHPASASQASRPVQVREWQWRRQPSETGFRFIRQPVDQFISPDRFLLSQWVIDCFSSGLLRQKTCGKTTVCVTIDRYNCGGTTRYGSSQC